jgi:hypothetical protein
MCIELSRNKTGAEAKKEAPIVEEHKLAADVQPRFSKIRATL